MPTDIWSVPKDPSTGAVRGSYFLRHDHDTSLSSTLGFVAFAEGRSVEPLTGRKLLTFVAAMGRDLSLEPADAEARAALGMAEPEPEAESTEEPEGSEIDPAGDGDPEAQSDGLDETDDLDALRAIAAAEGIEGAERWGKKRLVAAIREARASTDPAGDGEA